MSKEAKMSLDRGRRRFLAGAAAVAVGLPSMRTVLAQQANAAPYKIGVTYPLSGPSGSWGQLLVPAIEIGVQHINQADGVNGHPLALVVEDSKGNPEGAVSSMRKVVQVDGVQVIMTIFTNVVSAQIPLAQQFKVPLLSPVEAPGLVARSNHWAFAQSALLSRTLPRASSRRPPNGWERLTNKHYSSWARLITAASSRAPRRSTQTRFLCGATAHRTRARSCSRRESWEFPRPYL